MPRFLDHLSRRCAIASLLVAFLGAGCASLDAVSPGVGASPLWQRTTGITYRTFDAPMERVTPAMVSTLSQMGMMIASIEAQAGREILRARKHGHDVEVSLERMRRGATRARVAASTGGLLYDGALAARIVHGADRILAEEKIPRRKAMVVSRADP